MLSPLTRHLLHVRASLDPLRRLLLLLVVAALSLHAALGAGDPRRAFDLPAGDAASTLKRFVEQSGEQVLFVAPQVRGVVTRPVRGLLAPRQALAAMIEGTPLQIVEDDASGAVFIRRTPARAPGQGTPPAREPDRGGGRPAPGPSGSSAAAPRRGLAGLFALAFAASAAAAEPSQPSQPDESVVTLTPFEVVENNRGYLAQNTMSGTRLNSKLEDLGAAITVVTKQQMSDFALLDMNDIFNYEAGTEGTGNYTDLSFNRNGTVINNVQLDPQSANRLRGIGNANTTLGNFEMSGRMPIDPLGIDAVEISRGPNAAIFGIGNAGGSVNTVPAAAHLTRPKSQVALRLDSSDGYRASVDINRVLVPGMLALRGSAVRQKDGFEQKPSGVHTSRLNGMLRYRPFAGTMVSASLSHYDSAGRRPNFNTPFDLVSGWRAAGSPTYNGATGLVTRDGAASALPAATFNTLFAFPQAAYSALYIDQSGIAYWSTGRTTSSLNPNSASGSGRLYVPLSDPTANRASQTLFSRYPALTDRSLYDWKSINLAAPNYMSDRVSVASVLLDQVLLNSQRQLLALQLGWLHEGGRRFNRTLIGGDTRTGGVVGIAYDVNEKRLDGSDNPFFLRPYIQLDAPYDTVSTIDRDAYRAQLAYQLDFTGDGGWKRWLGRHQVSGYAEYKDYKTRTAYFTGTVVSDHSWNPHGYLKSAWGSGAAGVPVSPSVVLGSYRFYLGEKEGPVAYAPQPFSPGSYVMHYGNPTTGFVSEPVELDTAASGISGASSNQWKIQKVRGAVWQSHLLGDRIVGTLGVRHDALHSRPGGTVRFLEDGIHYDEDSFASWAPGAWRTGKGPTRTAGIVVRPLHWLSLYANKSDSFVPETPAQTLYFTPLSDPSGKGKDYGLGLNLFGGKLFVRINRYRTSQLLSRSGSAGTAATRAWRVDFTSATTYYGLTADPFRLQTKATEWVQAAAAREGTKLTDAQVEAQVAAIMKVPVAYLRNLELPIAATNDVIGRGHEIEVQYNPNRSWTTKLNVTEQQAVTANISPEVNRWISERLPVWQSIQDPELGVPWYTYAYTSAGSAKSFVDYNVVSPLKTAQVQEGKSRPQIRRYRANFFTNFRLEGVTANPFLRRCNIGGAVRWEDKGAIGYRGVETPPVIVTELDTSRPIYDRAHTYVDLLLGYRAPFPGTKASALWQLNVRNLNENGRLQPVSANPDGSASAYRIVAPRQFILSVTLDL